MGSPNDGRPVRAQLLPQGHENGPESTTPLRVQAGGRLRLRAEVENLGGSWETFDARLDGIPADWSTVFPSAVRLGPAGTEAAHATLEILVQPLFGVKRQTTHTEISITLTPQGELGRAQSDTLALAILPAGLEVTLAPPLSRAVSLAEFSVAARNRTGSTITAFLSARGDGLRFEVAQTAVPIDSEEQAWSGLGVRPSRRRIIGPSVERPFEIAYVSDDVDLPSETARGILLQTPLVPTWLVTTVLAAGLLIGLVLAFAVPRQTTVPDLAGAKFSTVVETLQSADLELGNQLSRAPAERPKAGTHVDQGTAVSVIVAAEMPATEAASPPAERPVAPEAPSSPPPRSPAAPASPPQLAPTLGQLVPDGVLPTCAPLAEPPAPASSAAFCRNGDGVELWYLQFPSLPAAESYYARRIAAAGAISDQGACGVDTVAETESALLGAPAAGRVLCGTDTASEPVLIFRDETTPAVIEARAADDRPLSGLLQWWQGGSWFASR